VSNVTRFRAVLPVLLLFALAVGIAGVPAEASQPGNERDVGAAAHQALTTDARAYAVEFGVTEAEALRRIKLQLQLAETTRELESKLPERFAGLWIEHLPEFRLVAWYTGDGAGLDEAAQVAAKSPVSVTILSGAHRSLNSLLSLQERIPEFLSPDQGLAGTNIDVRSGSLVAELQPHSPLSAQAPALEERLSNELQAPVQVLVLDSPAGDDATYGGKRIGSCTTAFTVGGYYGGPTGVLTAAHCTDTYPTSIYYENSSWSFLTSWVTAAHDASRDVVWHTVADPEYPEFWSGSEMRPVFGSVSRASQTLGTYTCTYGRISQARCGYLASKTYVPTYPGACPGGPCAATWMQISDCFGNNGDSGGPVYVGYDAYGVYKGSPGTSCIYMPIDYISAISVYLLTW
jgi:streptogrisin C